MLEDVISVGLNLAGAYLVCGAVFAVAFLTRGIHLLDSSAQGTRLGFKAIIFPGVLLLWPVLLFKWIKYKRQ